MFEAAQGVLLTLGEVLEKTADILSAQVARVTHSVEEDESSNPMDIPLCRFGSTETS